CEISGITLRELAAEATVRSAALLAACAGFATLGPDAPDRRPLRARTGRWRLPAAVAAVQLFRPGILDRNLYRPDRGGLCRARRLGGAAAWPPSRLRNV